MNRLKELYKDKKIIIGTVIIGILIVCIGGYFIYDNNKKQEIIDKMSISFNDVKEVEYGIKDYDVQKELVKEIKDATLKEVPKIDTSKVGEQVLKFILTQDNLEKEVEYKITIKDTKAPEIKFKEDSIELTVGDEFDIKSNIESVKDIVDGDIKENEKALELNKKATEEYNKLNKEDIKDNTKVAEKPLNEFLIEDIKDKEEKTLYLKNCYYVDGTIDTEKADEYTIKVIAIDKNGLKSTEEYKVTVKEKEIEIEQTQNNTSVNSGGNNYTSNGSTSNGGGNNSSTPAPSVNVGTKQDIINTAIAQIGKPYQRGATGPNAFDCSGLIYYAYTLNGWSIPRYPESGGTKIQYSQIQPGDIIYMPVSGNGQPHVMLFVGNGQAIEAQDAGVVYFPLVWGVQPDWQFIRY